MIVSVFIDNISIAGDKIYDYLVEDNLAEDIEIGKRVLVYFGVSKYPISALIVEIKEESEYKKGLKKIISILDKKPIIPFYLIEVVKYMRDQYFCTYNEALKSVIPSLEKVKKIEHYSMVGEYLQVEKHRDILDIIKSRNGKATADYISKKLNIQKVDLLKILKKLDKEEIISLQVEFKVKEDKIKMLSISKDMDREEILGKIRKNALKQLNVIEYLSKNKEEEYFTLLKEADCDKSTVDRLQALGFINVFYKSKELFDYEDIKSEKKNILLNKEQKEAVNTYINTYEKNKKFLLFGVTGSGKTEVYKEMFKDMIKKGKQCLFLVPEISLTPQMMKNIYSEFGGEVAIMHSKLTPAKRIEQWNMVRSGRAKVVLGARSAIFMPFKDLGLIVIDEEHENSYKSSSTPRYETVNLANYISDLTGCNLVLGSATPSVESYYKSKKGVYTLLKIANRANGKDFPPCHIVDMSYEIRNGNKKPLSRKLQEEVKKRLDKKEQVILFINRRGHSTYVFCRSCGYIEKCPNCDVSLTYHKGYHKISCHYCGYSKIPEKICPECSSDKIKFLGTGTEKIEVLVKELFPEARVLRMDYDTTRNKGSLEKILEDFSKERADILIGTQMVVKGLDFQNVTLVGILLADSSLNFPDINSPQRTFQLCTQAAGRAGRASKEGAVIMQTYEVKNKTLVYSSIYDYESFYAYDIQYRYYKNYPPFSEIMGIFTAYEEEEVAKKDGYYIHKKIENIIKENNINDKDVMLYAPTGAFIQKLKNKYIIHVLIRYNVDSKIKKILREEFSSIKTEVKSSVFVEINPVTLL